MTTNEKLFSFCQRQFDPKTTTAQLEQHRGAREVMQNIWNIDPRVMTLCNETPDVPDGMIFKVNHDNYNDLVMITLDWSDLYHIRFMNQDIEVTHEITEVYEDCLFGAINDYFNEGVILKNIVGNVCLN
jgi:hypothetical protein